jgi:hypothetical protein
MANPTNIILNQSCVTNIAAIPITRFKTAIILSMKTNDLALSVGGGIA